MYLYTFGSTDDVTEQWSQQAFVKPFNTDAGYHFGHSISLGDDKTLAVGAPDFGDTIGASTGAVYVYTRDDGNKWSLQKYLKAYDAAEQNVFGTKVDLSNDGNTLAVGAVGRNSSTGAVYVFSRNESSWGQQNNQPITASNAGSSDWFGNRLSLSGDGNTLAVSAKNEDNTLKGIISGNDFAEDNDLNCCSNSGAVYIFTRDDSIWLEKTYIKAKNPVSNDQFGESVALSGNGNTLVVGSAATASSDSFDKVYIY